MIYDITQELFSGEIWPGDARPVFKRLKSYEAGNTSQVTELSLNVHNATHLDAPIHRIRGGKSIDGLNLEACIGPCEVISYADKERLASSKAKRILLRDTKCIDEETARLLAERGVVFVGTEGISIGNREVHSILLGAEIVVLEGAVLSHVSAGAYFLSALPLKLAGCDGSPCRALLSDAPFS